MDKEVWLACSGSNLADFGWQGRTGSTRIGIGRAAYLMPGCTIAFPDGVEDVHEYSKSLPKSIHVWKKQSYVKYDFMNMSVWSHELHAPLRGSAITICLQLIGYYGGKLVHMIDCNSRFDEYETLTQIIGKYDLEIKWED